MAISVLCTSCSAPMTAPDTAAGKRVKCPKCQDVMQLPDAEAGADDFDASAPRKKRRAVIEEGDEEDRPRRNPISRGDDDDRPGKKSRRRDDEEDDYRPRKRGKAKSKAGAPVGLIVGGGIAALLFVAGGLFVLMRGGGGPLGAVPGGLNPALGLVPPGYTAVNEPRGGFSVALPGTIDCPKITINGIDGSELGVYVWRGKVRRDGDKLEVNVESRRLSDGIPDGTVTDQVIGIFNHRTRGATTQFRPDDVVVQRECKLAGRPALELRLSSNRNGDGNDNRKVYFALIHEGKLLFIRFITVGTFPDDETIKIVTESLTLS